MAHARQHSVQVTLDKEVTEAPELSTFTELGCWVTRTFKETGKKPAKKWLRYRDYTLYWCKSPEVQQAEGCIRLLSDSVTLHPEGERGIRLQCADKDRFFQFENELDINRWYDRITKTLTIRAQNGDNFRYNGKGVYTNQITLYMLTDQKWVVAGKGDLKIIVDRNDSGGIPDVAAKVNFAATDDSDEKAYSFLLYPYLKEKGGKTWIIPKVNDMNSDFALQTLAFRFANAEQSQMFHAMFDNIFRTADVDTKEQTDDHMRQLEQENTDLKTENTRLQERISMMQTKQDTLKRQLEDARAEVTRLKASGGGGGSSSNRQGGKTYSRAEAMRWNVDQVADWLVDIGMSRYAAEFREFELDGSILVQDMTSDSLTSDLNMPQSDALVITSAIAKFTGRSDGGGAAGSGDRTGVKNIFDSGAYKDMVRKAVDAKSSDIRTIIRRALASGSETKELNDLKLKLIEYEKGGLVSQYTYQQTVDEATRQGREEEQDIDSKMYAVNEDLMKGVNFLKTLTRERSETTRILRNEMQKRTDRIGECERDVSSRKGSLKVRKGW